MIMNFNKMLFTFTLNLGMLVSISSNSWMLIWAGLEISLVSIMPLMCKKSLMSSESTLKYFIIQSVSSSLMMLGVLMMVSHKNMSFNQLIVYSIMLKIGIAPLHNWMIQISESLEWLNLFLILTILKIAPLNLLTYLNMKLNFYLVSSLILGSTLAMNQNSVRKLLTYSSIFNMGFILASLSLNSVWMLYLIVYMFTFGILILFLSLMNLTYLNQMIINNKFKIMKLKVFMVLISMGGMPPMTSFLAKIMVIQVMILNKSFFTLIIIMITSMMVLFFYMRMSFLIFTFSSMKMKWNLISLQEDKSWMMILVLTLSPLFLSFKFLS
uniref:NADH dehydrogenase subunit 2 n=1 Tax=Multinervis guangxiensis TaxID=1792637 RepID=UPI003003A550|nr:NADH dehydrogenase subunit 2 [Multinervis guangxiensis]